MQLTKRAPALLALFLAFLATAATIFAQAPTGNIGGTVTDASGGVIPNATVTVTDKATASARTLTTNAEGIFSAPSLPSGDYEVKAEVTGFKTLVRQATVTAGVSSTVDMAMAVGQATDVVNVEATAAQINYESHSVQGVVARTNIQELPINGRSFLSIASLEPGVTTTPGTAAQFNSLVTVVPLGGGGYTRFTIDGGIVNDEWEGNGSTGMNVSQEVVQEFQMSTANFGVAAGIGSGGQVNIVTRSGGNDFHGSGYFFFRDRNMAAYPGLKRATDPSLGNPLCANPTSAACQAAKDPYFGRRNPGLWVGGPIIKNKLFFFTNYEYMNQVQVYTITEDLKSLAGLSSTPASPYHNTLFSHRFDYQLNTKNTLFVRYTHDGNLGFGPYGGTQPSQSSWSSNKNWSDQIALGVTTIITSNIVNDARAFYHFWQNNVEVASASQCPAPCPGFGLPSLVAGMQGSATFYAGVSDNSPQPRQARVYEFVDNLSWQKGAHRIGMGADYERIVTKNTWDFCINSCLGLYSPETTLALAGQANINTYLPNMPTSVSTSADMLGLPVFNTSTSIYSGVDVGDGRFPGPYNRTDFNHNSRPRFFINDAWKVSQNLTINGGVAYEFETGLWYNLPFPSILSPIIGNNLAAPPTNYSQFAPQIGFAYALGKDKKTVIRGGAGMFWDSENLWHHFRAGASLGPVGNGRTTLSAGSLTNIFPGIVNMQTGAALPVGSPLPLSQLTNMTLAQYIQIYNAQIPMLTQQLAPTPQTSGPFTVSGLDVAKTAVELHTPDFKVMRSYQTSIGVQRDLGHDFLAQVDWARRQFENVDMGELDLNRSLRTLPGTATTNSVIPVCSAAQKFVPGQQCSTGSVTFWVPQGRTIYNGLLVKVTKRMSNRFAFIASYALQNQNTVVAPTYDLNNYFTTYGDNISRHLLNFAPIVTLPWGIKLTSNTSLQSKLPFEPLVVGPDLFGSGTTLPLSIAVPNIPYNCFGLSCSQSQLTTAIAAYNANVAGTKDLRGNVIKPIGALPTGYQFGAPKYNTDVRITKQLTLKERYKLEIFAEAFNVFNIANLTGYSTVLGGSFGLPTARVGQVFGSGGPRAEQVGARVSF